MSAHRPLTSALVLVVMAAAAGCSSNAAPPVAGRPAPVARPQDGVAAGSGTSGGPSRYFAARFDVSNNASTLGSVSDWLPGGGVVTDLPDAAGVTQIVRSNLDGTGQRCLTCGRTGPNAFPRANPKLDWVLYGSWRGQKTTLGAPLYGGAGGELYVMRRDGSEDTRLTFIAPTPADHAEDNYHPFWSADGRHLVWTHVDFRPVASGGTRWSIRIGDFVDTGGPPRLVDVRDVGPSDEAGIETQAWAPDGSGFLYMHIGRGPTDWMNSELYFMRIHGDGATPDHPQISHLTDGSPAWDEQARFTPDGTSVVWMSSRGAPSWYESVVAAAQWLHFAPPQPNTVFGAVFFRLVADPTLTTDLYMLDLRTRAVRRLTDDRTIISDFDFDPSGTRLLWSSVPAALRRGSGEANPTVTRVGRFDLGTSTGGTTGTPPSALSKVRWLDPGGPVRGLTQPILDGPVLLAKQLAELDALIHAQVVLPGRPPSGR